MQFGKHQDRPSLASGVSAPRQPWRLSGWKMLVCLAALAALSRAAQNSLPNTNKPTLPAFLTNPPDKNAQMEMNERQQEQRKQNFEAANVERKRQIAEDSANLLKLAVELKAEVDKTNKDVLSITVIRKADAIEKLARQVKEKMKLTVGAG